MAEQETVSKVEFEALCSNVRFAADNAFLDTAGLGLTSAHRVRNAVDAALLMAVGNGLVRMVPASEWASLWLAINPDDHPIQVV